VSIVDIPCAKANYGGARTRPQYIVIHYTAGDGDTAADNGRYFASRSVGASAHYFVDEKQIVRSVPEEAAAWHCGAAVYRHGQCRNRNSIGVELCSRRENGSYVFAPETVERAAGLVRSLMEQYGIPVERVLRHYDVTGKLCPAPFLEEAAWQAFRARLEEHMTQTEFAQAMERYLQTLAAQPPGGWSQQARDWAEQQGLIRGDGQSMAYRRPVTREELVEILYRLEGDRP